MLSFIPAGLAMCALIVCLATFNSELYYWLGMMFAAIFCSAGIICAVCEKERLNGRKRSILAAVWVVAIAAALCFLTAGLFISAGYTMLVLMLLAPVTLLAAAIAHVVINNKFIKKNK